MPRPHPGEGGWGTATLWHFSPVFSFTPDDFVWLPKVRQIAEETGRAMAEARELLKTKGFKIPAVPDIPWECRDDAAWKQADRAIVEFIKEFRQPEVGISSRLLIGVKMAEIAGLKADGVNDMIARLLRREGDKVIELLKTTKGQPEKIQPVLRAAMQIGQDMSLIGADCQGFMGALAPWVEASLDPVIRAIREEHDDAQAEAAWEIGRTVQLLAGKSRSRSSCATSRPRGSTSPSTARTTTRRRRSSRSC